MGWLDFQLGLLTISTMVLASMWIVSDYAEAYQYNEKLTTEFYRNFRNESNLQATIKQMNDAPDFHYDKWCKCGTKPAKCVNKKPTGPFEIYYKSENDDYEPIKMEAIECVSDDVTLPPFYVIPFYTTWKYVLLPHQQNSKIIEVREKYL